MPTVLFSCRISESGLLDICQCHWWQTRKEPVHYRDHSRNLVLLSINMLLLFLVGHFNESEGCYFLSEGWSEHTANTHAASCQHQRIVFSAHRWLLWRQLNKTCNALLTQCALFDVDKQQSAHRKAGSYRAHPALRKWPSLKTVHS